MVQSDGLELLGRMVAPQRRDAHLRDRLENALLGGGDVLIGELIGPQFRRQIAVGLHLVDGLEGHVGIDRVGAVAAKRQKCITSRGSPLSTTMPTSPRSPRASRPWCNAEVANRLGIAAILGETPRSLRISSEAPLRIARSAPSTNSANACAQMLARLVAAGREQGSAASPP